MYNMQTSYGIGLLLTGAAYGRLGKALARLCVANRAGYNHLTETYIDLLLDCFGHCTPLEDILRASCRTAYAVGPPTSVSSILMAPGRAMRRVRKGYQHHR
jgi:hypothetical protein